MLEAIGFTLGGLAVLGLVGVGGFLWWRARVKDQAIQKAASQTGGGGGPSEPA